MSSTAYAHVIVDSGPLVAIFDRSDQYHEICCETLAVIQPPMWTTWPVLTEVAWLLRDQPKGMQRLYAGVSTGFFRIASLSESEFGEMEKIQERFQTLNLQLADVTLLVLAEREKWNTVFTLDRRDFSVIQKKSRPKLILLPETIR